MTPDLILRLAAIVAGLVLAVVGMRSLKDDDTGCLPFVLVLVGCLLFGAIGGQVIAP